MLSPIRLSKRTLRVVHNGQLHNIAEIEQADWGVIPPGQPVFVAVVRRLTPYHSGGGMVLPVASGALYAARILSNSLYRLGYDGYNHSQTLQGSLVLEISAGPVWGNLPGCHPHQEQAPAAVLTLPHTEVYRIYFLLPPPAPRPARRKPTT